jgi:hypothetical protein
MAQALRETNNMDRSCNFISHQILVSTPSQMFKILVLAKSIHLEFVYDQILKLNIY